MEMYTHRKSVSQLDYMACEQIEASDDGLQRCRPSNRDKAIPFGFGPPTQTSQRPQRVPSVKNRAKQWHDLKQRGNDLFTAGEHLKAAAMFTSAIKACSGSGEELAVLYSNRCAALIKIAKLSKALTDAEKCIQLRPDWEKSYYRKGCTLEAMSNFETALDVYKLGLQHAPESRELSSRISRLEPLVRKQKRSSKTKT